MRPRFSPRQLLVLVNDDEVARVFQFFAQKVVFENSLFFGFENPDLRKIPRERERQGGLV